MRTFALLLIFNFTSISMIMAQEKADDALPYRQIPNAPAIYSAGDVAARMVDGLGFRYFWATEGLTTEDLDYRPSPGARTTRETLEHIHGLSMTIANAVQNKVNSRQINSLSFEDLREQTLQNLQLVSGLLRDATESEVADMKIIFKQGENTIELPFWNVLNGPIADAIYHTGQIVSFRRASGNPIAGGVDVLRGIKK